MKKKGFTLIELILVMTLLSILALVMLSNFNNSLKRGRDSQRKNDLNQLQKALENYYEDHHTYPTFTDIFARKLCTNYVCLTSDTVYMIKTATDPLPSSFKYVYAPEPTAVPVGPSSYYYLYTYIENDADQDPNISKTGFTTNVTCNVSGVSLPCRYYVSSSNAERLTANP